MEIDRKPLVSPKVQFTDADDDVLLDGIACAKGDLREVLETCPLGGHRSKKSIIQHILRTKTFQNKLASRGW